MFIPSVKDVYMLIFHVARRVHLSICDTVMSELVGLVECVVL